jgi:hypothetical protein
MKHLLRHPAVNALGISLFTTYYAIVFFVTAGHPDFIKRLSYNETSSDTSVFWKAWSRYLAGSGHIWIAVAMIACSTLVLLILILRRHPYDEYHTVLLMNCLVVATVLTLLAIAVFFLMILLDPAGIVEKFMLFIVIHWITVVLANLIYLLICRSK